MSSPAAALVPTRQKQTRWRAGMVLLLLVVIGLMAVVLPLFYLRPFRTQTAAEISIALSLFRWAPWLTIALLLTGTFLLDRKWSGSRLLFRTGGIVAVLLLAFTCFAARQNVFERMFHPVPLVTFLGADTNWVAVGDTVLGVKLQGDARAYPVKEMAYHHVVNDALHGLPIVVTY